MTDVRDRELGMARPIARRDFLNGMALVLGSLAVPPWLRALDLEEAAPEKAPGYYPPALTGLRGSHEGAYEVAHALRDGTFWATAGPVQDTGEVYDLVVVGGGISGLAAAHFFRQAAGPSTRVLVLENHDDFGGHAKRNEFHAGSRLLIGYGGTQSIESPAPYSPVARGLLAELGIDMGRWARVLDGRLYPSLGLRPGFFFDRETFGTDRLVAGLGEVPSAPFLAPAPLSPAVRRDILRIHEEGTDYLPGLSSAEKKARLARVSYAGFLTQVAGLDPGVLPFFQARTHSLYGVGIDAVPAQDAWGLGLPGFQGMKLEPGAGPGMNRDAIRYPEAEAYFFHFPDGNATVARLLVRRLVPRALPGRSLDDVVTARADYARLDEAPSPVRVRLNSTAVRVRHLGEPGSAREVEVLYVRGGKPFRVRGRSCVLACWNGVIPPLPGAAGEAEVGPGLRRQGPHRLQHRPHRELGVLREAGGEQHPRSRELPLDGGPGPSGEPGAVPVLAAARGAHPAPPHARAVLPGAARARPAPGGAGGAAGHSFRGLRAAHPGPARPHAGPRRLRRGPGHPGHHREPLAPRLRLPVQLALGPGLARLRAALRGGPPALRAHRHRQRRRRGLRLHRFRHRPGPPRRAGAGSRLS
jgi:putative NAD(P)-binding protein